ncbi:MAG: glycine cleavage system aminomethyltransferase GcvT [Phycisphaeraceae bacterium]|nr:glycine cleavage system aminomethyltransferase GcvT [Phycisphaeraceae bacterium]MCW5764234.1 glycine cleavage system aminomethyltransferase GcvT [Phycisphaeraceae bacterium]
MHQSPLHDFHAEHGAHFVEFAGWSMPIRYGSIQEEHLQVRRSGGLFDVSHMGRVNFSGMHARRLLEHCCTRKIGDMQAGQCRYSLVCNEQGGVRDDVIVMRHEEDEFTVVINASNREKLLAHFEAVRERRGWKVKFDDRTMATAMVALQGPKVMELISRVSSEIPTLKRYRFTTKNLLVMKLIVSRTGYTGEDGVEVILPAKAVGMALKLLLKDAGLSAEHPVVRPIGLGARDSLRLEAGMPLYGHELGEEINALETGLDFAIAMDKSEAGGGERFIGQDALEATQAKGVTRKLVGIACDGKRTPRQGMPIKVGEAEIGQVTSGCLSPTLERPIAMGFVPIERAGAGQAVQIDAGKALIEGQVVPLPFYKAPKA